jgi:hypothetical protein
MKTSGMRALAAFAAFMTVIAFILLAVFLPKGKKKGESAPPVARAGCPAGCQCTRDYAPGTKYDLQYEKLVGADNKTTCTFTQDGFRMACPMGCCSPRCV